MACLLVLLLVVLAIGAIHHWASNNFYLTRTQTIFVCFLAFLLALAAFVVGWLGGKIKFLALPILFFFYIIFFFSGNHVTNFIAAFADRAFVGASVGYFSFLFLLAGRALTVSLVLHISNRILITFESHPTV